MKIPKEYFGKEESHIPMNGAQRLHIKESNYENIREKLEKKFKGFTLSQFLNHISKD